MKSYGTEIVLQLAGLYRFTEPVIFALKNENVTTVAHHVNIERFQAFRTEKFGGQSLTFVSVFNEVVYFGDFHVWQI